MEDILGYSDDEVAVRIAIGLSMLKLSLAITLPKHFQNKGFISKNDGSARAPRWYISLTMSKF